MPDPVPGVPGGPEERTWDERFVPPTDYVRKGGNAIISSGGEYTPSEARDIAHVVLEVMPELFAARERSRGLEAALTDIVEERSATVFRGWDSYWDWVQKVARDALASLSAVPDVQDGDGYEARPASPGAAREGQDVGGES